MSPLYSPRARLSAGTALALTVALVSAGCAAKSTPAGSPQTPSPTTSTSSPAAQHAAAYVAGHLKEGDHVEGKFGADLGQTSDVALGLAATGGQPATLAKVLTYLDTHGAAYVHGDPSSGEKTGAHYAGSTGKLAFVARATGKNPASFGGLDLISELRALMGKDGRFLDNIQSVVIIHPPGQPLDSRGLDRC